MNGVWSVYLFRNMPIFDKDKMLILSSLSPSMHNMMSMTHQKCKIWTQCKRAEKDLLAEQLPPAISLGGEEKYGEGEGPLQGALIAERIILQVSLARANHGGAAGE